jgi:predicted Rossmann fold nucleotide-binding protein DprA/Smf involved in DNA uptake
MTQDTALDILRRATSPMSAQAIAQHLGLTVEETYLQLVKAEAAGFTRVVSAGGVNYHRMAWEIGVNV